MHQFADVCYLNGEPNCPIGVGHGALPLGYDLVEKKAVDSYPVVKLTGAADFVQMWQLRSPAWGQCEYKLAFQDASMSDLDVLYQPAVETRENCLSIPVVSGTVPVYPAGCSAVLSGSVECLGEDRCPLLQRCAYAADVFDYELAKCRTVEGIAWPRSLFLAVAVPTLPDRVNMLSTLFSTAFRAGQIASLSRAEMHVDVVEYGKHYTSDVLRREAEGAVQDRDCWR